jgi:hypothetical protein
MYAKLSHRAYLDSGLSPAPIASASYLPEYRASASPSWPVITMDNEPSVSMGEVYAPLSRRYWRKLRNAADANVPAPSNMDTVRT